MFQYRLVAFVFILSITVVAERKVLFIGDSWAELATAKVFEEVCVGSMLVNEGKSGSTAQMWRNELASQLQTILDANPDAEAVWISLGGNDMCYGSIKEVTTDVAENMRAVVAEVVEALPGANVLLSRYARKAFNVVPIWLKKYYECTIADYEQYGSDMQEIANDYPTVTFVDTFYLFGGSPNEPSDLRFWLPDLVHINNKGYRKLWENQDVKNVVCPCNLPDDPECTVIAEECNWLTSIGQLLFGWLGFDFCSL